MKSSLARALLSFFLYRLNLRVLSCLRRVVLSEHWGIYVVARILALVGRRWGAVGGGQAVGVAVTSRLDFPPQLIVQTNEIPSESSLLRERLLGRLDGRCGCSEERCGRAGQREGRWWSVGYPWGARSPVREIGRQAGGRQRCLSLTALEASAGGNGSKCYPYQGESDE
ncbi:hypothetical protein F4780DRAFT_416553 [Xylariomycetidae sp. FL0641]|nr:hypothetical protein F4780DRAFT_416553 [Xylariomycetidae sp. FL0641]